MRTLNERRDSLLCRWIERGNKTRANWSLCHNLNRDVLSLEGFVGHINLPSLLAHGRKLIVLYPRGYEHCQSQTSARVIIVNQHGFFNGWFVSDWLHFCFSLFLFPHTQMLRLSRQRKTLCMLTRGGQQTWYVWQMPTPLYRRCSLGNGWWVLQRTHTRTYLYIFTGILRWLPFFCDWLQSSLTSTLTLNLTIISYQYISNLNLT